MKKHLKNRTHETDNMSGALDILCRGIARLADKDSLTETAVPGLSFSWRSKPTQPYSAMYDPCICVAVQGAKRVVLGNDAYVYDAQHYLITPINLPTVVQILKASTEKPFLGMILKLDMRMLAELMVDSDLPHPQVPQPGTAMATGRLTQPLLDAFQRLVDLLDESRDIPILAPIIKREIFYRLLVGEQGMRLRQMASAGSQGNKIARAIEWLKENFTQQPLRIDDLAAQVNMSTSTFHHHFRALTAMSPLQYQKWLRLNEARRLMLADNRDAAAAAFEVGYESPSQFSREYSRLFGAPPLRDISSLRQTANSAE